MIPVYPNWIAPLSDNQWALLAIPNLILKPKLTRNRLKGKYCFLLRTMILQHYSRSLTHCRWLTIGILEKKCRLHHIKRHRGIHQQQGQLPLPSNWQSICGAKIKLALPTTCMPLGGQVLKTTQCIKSIDINHSVPPSSLTMLQILHIIIHCLANKLRS